LAGLSQQGNSLDSTAKTTKAEQLGRKSHALAAMTGEQRQSSHDRTELRLRSFSESRALTGESRQKSFCLTGMPGQDNQEGISKGKTSMDIGQDAGKWYQ
jgi:hypothetical protein